MMSIIITKDNYCCVRQPLVEIDLDHVIVDELHLMLRVVDVLIDNLVEDVLEWDNNEDIRKKRKEERGKHLNNLVTTIRSCGVSFNIWQKKNADEKTSGKYEWTSLLGNDKKSLLRVLPGKLRMALQDESCDTVIKIWEDFYDLYKKINEKQATLEGILQYSERAKDWIKLFLSLNGIRKGYQKSRVTPYMHIMVFHVLHFLTLYKTISTFSGQGVEKNNDVARSTVMKKSNKWDCTSDVLKLESRQRELCQHERQKRIYKKNDESYWETGILENRKRRNTRSPAEHI